MINSAIKFLTIYFVLLGVSATLWIFVPDIGFPLFHNTASIGTGVLHEIQSLVL